MKQEVYTRILLFFLNC